MKKFIKIIYKIIIRLITFTPFLILISISIIRRFYWYFRNFILYGFELGVYDDQKNPATISMVYDKIIKQQEELNNTEVTFETVKPN